MDLPLKKEDRTDFGSQKHLRTQILIEGVKDTISYLTRFQNTLYPMLMLRLLVLVVVGKRSNNVSFNATAQYSDSKLDVARPADQECDSQLHVVDISLLLYFKM